MYFPIYRPRRLRQNEKLRSLVRETQLSVNDLIYPMFVVPGSGVTQEISSMPGVFHYSVDTLTEQVKAVRDAGIPAIILFGLPPDKDEGASGAFKADGIVQTALESLKKNVPDIILITDVCLCEYMSHGHCGIIDGEEILNDPTLEILAKTAVSHVKAGADIVAPSDMMDGRIMAIREALDDNDYSNTPIISYAAKYSSAFYGPFREAADSAPQFGDRRSYQMDPANRREAIREVSQDISEGADIVMVKPALTYMDIIADVKREFDLPVAAYNVSGEYAMVKAAAARGWIDGKKVTLETLLSMKRAGADIILTYHALEVAEWLK